MVGRDLSATLASLTDGLQAITTLRRPYGILEDLQPLGSSRAGTPSWRGILDGRPVKLFRCASIERAELIAWVSASETAGSRFPRCHGRDEMILVVDWIEGESLDKQRFRRDHRAVEWVGETLAALHRLAPEESPTTDSGYQGYLFQRLGTLAEKLDQPHLVDVLVAHLDVDGRQGISHPDLAPQNLVRTANGKLVSIDNELMAASPCQTVDLFNPARYLGRFLRRRSNVRRMVAAYQNGGGDLTMLGTQAKSAQALWAARRIGSLLEDGRLEEARELGNTVISGSLPEHPVIQAARELSR